MKPITQMRDVSERSPSDEENRPGTPVVQSHVLQVSQDPSRNNDVVAPTKRKAKTKGKVGEKGATPVSPAHNHESSDEDSDGEPAQKLRLIAPPRRAGDQSGPSTDLFSLPAFSFPFKKKVSAASDVALDVVYTHKGAGGDLPFSISGRALLDLTASGFSLLFETMETQISLFNQAQEILKRTPGSVSIKKDLGARGLSRAQWAAFVRKRLQEALGRRQVTVKAGTSAACFDRENRTRGNNYGYDPSSHLDFRDLSSEALKVLFSLHFSNPLFGTFSAMELLLKTPAFIACCGISNHSVRIANAKGLIKANCPSQTSVEKKFEIINGQVTSREDWLCTVRELAMIKRRLLIIKCKRTAKGPKEDTRSRALSFVRENNLQGVSIRSPEFDGLDPLALRSLIRLRVSDLEYKRRARGVPNWKVTNNELWRFCGKNSALVLSAAEIEAVKAEEQAIEKHLFEEAVCAEEVVSSERGVALSFDNVDFSLLDAFISGDLSEEDLVKEGVSLEDVSGCDAPLDE